MKRLIACFLVISSGQILGQGPFLPSGSLDCMWRSRGGHDATSYSHELLSVCCLPVSVQVSSNFFSLPEGSGTAIDEVDGAMFAVAAKSGKTGRAMTFKKTGLNG
jgi:hypothetical protein